MLKKLRLGRIFEAGFRYAPDAETRKRLKLTNVVAIALVVGMSLSTLQKASAGMPDWMVATIATHALVNAFVVGINWAGLFTTAKTVVALNLIMANCVFMIAEGIPSGTAVTFFISTVLPFLLFSPRHIRGVMALALFSVFANVGATVYLQNFGPLVELPAEQLAENYFSLQILPPLVVLFSIRSLYMENARSEKALADNFALLDQTTSKIRQIMENVPFGLMMCDARGEVIRGHSHSTARLLNQESNDLAGRSISDLLNLNERDRGNFTALYEQVFEEDFPEFCASQLPESFEINGRKLEFTYFPRLNKEEKAESLLVVVADVTELHKTIEENNHNRALLKLASNRSALLSLVNTASDVDTKSRSSKASDTELRRDIHTLKGNLSSFGFDSVAGELHSLESLNELSPDAVESHLSAFWKELEEHNQLFHVDTESRKPGVILKPRHAEKIVSLLTDGSAPEGQRLTAIRNVFQETQSVDAKQVAQSLKQEAERLAKRLERKVRIETKVGDVQVPSDYSPVIASFTHIVRNSLDHGFAGRGSSRDNLFTISIQSNSDTVSFVFEDNGNGVNLEKLSKKVVSAGMCSAEEWSQLSPEAQANYIFAAGLSTKDEVTELSGRGAGMDAVRSSALEFGGNASVKSTAGKGTTITITLPQHIHLAEAA